MPPVDKEYGCQAAYEDAKGCIGTLEQQFKVSEKSVGAFMRSRIANQRYDGPKGVRGHIVELVNLTENFKEAKPTMSDELLSQIILNSLPSSFDSFIITYNQREEKWFMNEIFTNCDQEERRMR